MKQLNELIELYKSNFNLRLELTTNIIINLLQDYIKLLLKLNIHKRNKYLDFTFKVKIEELNF